ncbi:KamA family radical SAM protein [Myroides indicus]|uniref:KamA family protein n=1 Tax=Myroides indicus TaxID=1323422 RepID=A0A4R7FFF6_9FLAO|nr:lysine 2,3-aminomutase [Myroides indicus]TDS66240.1 KamA family protein [Myroides indicus]
MNMEPMKYKAYLLSNFKTIPQLEKMNAEDIEAIEVVGNVLPFKVNNYVINELIDWDNYKTDPIFRLTFPQKEMLSHTDYELMRKTLQNTQDKAKLKEIANKIRYKLNPHPAGQMELNVPSVGEHKLPGVQHKYDQTALFFPSSGQTCHSYCTFCFRWAQFVGMDDMKFAMRETDLLVQYLEEHQEVTDLLFTGGDPMIMSYKVFSQYITPFLSQDNKTNIQTIRIGTKSLGFWPYKFLTDADADDFIALFKKIVDSGINLSIMAHFNHPNELKTQAVQEAVKVILATGAQIRTQSPLIKGINNSADVWAHMWREQVNMGMIPYYMFVERDTGAQHYFEVPLEQAWYIFRKAYQQVSGICRTVRGPSMSCTPGKVQILGVTEIEKNGKMQKAFALRMIQGRNPNWVGKVFFAKYDSKASWMDDLQPFYGNEFFFNEELREMIQNAG